MPTQRPLLMGIVNVTPDSFSDGGRFIDPAHAVRHGLRLLEEGADWLDVGGESTRPGAGTVGARAEIGRVIPVIEGLKKLRPDARISVDTSKAAVAAEAIDSGASMVNDVRAAMDREMGPLCAARGVSVILMHMRGRPKTMQGYTEYSDLVAEVTEFLCERVAAAVDAGVARDRIWVDPGIGFAKRLQDNPALIRATPQIAKATGCPVVVGASRKKFVGEITGVERAADRIYGSVGAALAAASFGAGMIRVHDVAATVQALAVFDACRDAS
jgi:dihydropteroate synthase